MSFFCILFCNTLSFLGEASARGVDTVALVLGFLTWTVGAAADAGSAAVDGTAVAGRLRLLEDAETVAG